MTRRPFGFTVAAVVFAIVGLLSAWQLVAPVERALGVMLPAWWRVALALETLGAFALVRLTWRMDRFTLPSYITWGVLAIAMSAWYQHVVAASVLAFAQELGFDAPDRMSRGYEIASNLVNIAFVAAGYAYLSRRWPPRARSAGETVSAEVST